MKRAVSALAAFSIVLASTAAAAQTGQVTASDAPLVVSTGEGVVKRAPDRAWVTVTAESRAKNPREAQRLNAEVMTAVLKKLKSAGLADDALQTRGYDLHPEYDYNDGRQTLRGYFARNSVEVRIDDLAKVGELLDIAVTSGATSVGNVRFDLKDRAGAEREALRLAVADARRRADASASGAGMTVERIVRIEEQHARVVPPPMPYELQARVAMSSDRPAPPVAPGELEVRANVTLIAAIK